MKKCLFCGKEFEELSEEHIIPNVICGRIKSKNLLCKDCNSWLGENIDNELEKAYAQIIIMFRIKRERGTPQAIKVEDINNNQEYIYDYNGSYGLADTYIEETPMDNGGYIFHLHINPKNKKQLKNALGKLLASKKDELSKIGIDYKEEIKKQFQMIDDNWAETIKHTKKFKPSTVMFQASYGGIGIALAILKIAYLFLKDVKPNIKIDDENIIEILKNKSDEVWNRCYYYSLNNDLFKEIPDEISHFIFIQGIKNENKIVAYIKLFSVTPYICILSSNYNGENFAIPYGYNLLSQQTFSPICYQLDKLDDLDNILNYKKNFDIASKNIKKDLSRIMELYYKLYPTAKYNELQLDIYNRLKELKGDEFIKNEWIKKMINIFNSDYSQNISEEQKKLLVESITSIITKVDFSKS